MSLDRGSRLGPYEILDSLGGGGMGEVYRARDARLGRLVALKVLRGDLGVDGERLKRFAQEARAASALNHPYIVTVYDFDQATRDGDAPVAYLAMELVDGEPLRALVAGGGVALRRALGIAAQIAEGLAVAHERGIVHRDLKLDNVMVTRDGRVKILDFGIAKVLGDAVPLPADVSLPLPTREGLVNGTPGYMAPELINGESADYRVDQFALGVIVYELIAGRHPFGGTGAFEKLSAIVRDEPTPLRVAAPQAPGQVAWVVERLLAKSPDERYQSTRDLARELARLRDVAPPMSAGTPTAFALPVGLGATEGARDAGSDDAASVRDDATPVTPRAGTRDATSTTVTLPPSPHDAKIGRRALAPRTASVALLLLLGTAIGWMLHRPAEPRPPQLRPLTFSGSDEAPDASPDGSLVAFVSARDGRRRIWLKQMVGGSEAPLTAGADSVPRFSPDGGRVLFSRFDGTHRNLFRTAVVGGEERRLVSNASSGDWSPDGRRIAFVRNRDDGTWSLSVVDVDGGAEHELLRVRTNTMGRPAWSPDGRRIVVVTGVTLTGAPSQVRFVDLKSGTQTVLPGGPVLSTPSAPAWLPDSRSVLLAQAVDVRSTYGAIVRLSLDGRSRPLLWSLNLGPAVSVAGPGKVIFEDAAVRINLVAYELGGGEPVWLTRGHAIDRQPRFSPDGRRIVFSSNRSGNLDLWEMELASGVLRRLTDSPQEDWDPAYVGSGNRIVWSSRRSGNLEIWMAAADGSTPRQLTHDGVDAENPSSSPDGRWVTYTSLDPAHRGIWRIGTDGKGAVNLVPGDHGLSEISPDGRYVLYRSDPGPTSLKLYAVRLADGSPVPGFRVRRTVLPSQVRGVVQGRARWLPDGSGVAFVAVDERNVSGVWEQDFVPGRDTSAGARKLAGFDLPGGVESFTFSPDGKRIVIATSKQTSALVMADGVDGVD